MNSSRIDDRRDGTINELVFIRDVLKTPATLLSVKPIVKELLELECPTHPQTDLMDAKISFNGIDYWVEFKGRGERYKHFSLWEDYRVVEALLRLPSLLIELTPSGYSYADCGRMQGVPADVWFKSYKGASPVKQWMWHRRWPEGSYKEGFFFGSGV